GSDRPARPALHLVFVNNCLAGELLWCHLDRARRRAATEWEWRDPEDVCAKMPIQGVFPRLSPRQFGENTSCRHGRGYILGISPLRAGESALEQGLAALRSRWQGLGVTAGKTHIYGSGTTGRMSREGNRASWRTIWVAGIGLVSVAMS